MFPAGTQQPPQLVQRSDVALLAATLLLLKDFSRPALRLAGE